MTEENTRAITDKKGTHLVDTLYLYEVYIYRDDNRQDGRMSLTVWAFNAADALDTCQPYWDGYKLEARRVK